MRYRDQQLDFDMTAYVQVNAAAKKAWHRLLSSKEQAVELSSIRQGPDKLFQDFVSRLTQTSNRLIGDTEAGQSIVKELAVENPNAVRKEALKPFRKQGVIVYKWQHNMPQSANRWHLNVGLSSEPQNTQKCGHVYMGAREGSHKKIAPQVEM